nr:hypothetical protein [Tanacetum cinerariifolium]
MSIEIEKINKEKELRQREQAANLSTYTVEPSQHFNFIFYDDDDKERTIPLSEIISRLPPYEVIKSSVKDLVLIPSKSEDTSGSDSECDLPTCDVFSPIDVPEVKYVALSNPLFDSNDDFTSTNDESLSDEDVLKDNVKIYSNPLFEFDDKYISSGDIDKIDAFLDIDVSTNIEDDHDPRSLKDEPDNDNLKSMVKVFDPEIHEKIISLTYMRLPFEDRHYFSLTYVIRIFLPYFTYSMDSSLLLPSGSEDTIFDPGISVFSFYSLEPM